MSALAAYTSVKALFASCQPTRQASAPQADRPLLAVPFSLAWINISPGDIAYRK